VGRVSVGSFQAVVSMLAGVASITGAAYSAVQYLKPGTGELRIVVHAEKDGRPLPGSTIDVATADETPVTTLTTGDDGSAHKPVRAGAYRVRVAAPRFVAQTRDVQIASATAADVRFDLARRETERPSMPARGHAGPVSRGVGAAGQFLRRLGL